MSTLARAHVMRAAAVADGLADELDGIIDHHMYVHAKIGGAQPARLADSGGPADPPCPLSSPGEGSLPTPAPLDLDEREARLLAWAAEQMRRGREEAEERMLAWAAEKMRRSREEAETNG